MVAQQKIGLSLSYCVWDNVCGLVAYDDVVKIVAGIKAPTEEVFIRVVAKYQTMLPWTLEEDDPERSPAACAGVALRLYREGKIEQPRLLGNPPPDTRNGWWVEVE